MKSPKRQPIVVSKAAHQQAIELAEWLKTELRLATVTIGQAAGFAISEAHEKRQKYQHKD